MVFPKKTFKWQQCHPRLQLPVHVVFLTILKNLLNRIFKNWKFQMKANFAA